MKKAIILIVVALAGIFSAQAQGGGGFQRRTVEERVKSVMERLEVLKLDKDQTVKTDSVFAEAYRIQDKAREDMRAGGAQPDRDQMREKMQKLNDDRDEKLKKIFTPDQFKKWKDEIQPAMRQRNGGGGGGNN